MSMPDMMVERASTTEQSDASEISEVSSVSPKTADSALASARRHVLPLPISPKGSLFVMLAASFVTCSAQSMLSAALPYIMSDFNVDTTLAQLLTTGYFYVLGILSVLTAFLSIRLIPVSCFLRQCASL